MEVVKTTLSKPKKAFGFKRKNRPSANPSDPTTVTITTGPTMGQSITSRCC